MYSLIIDSFYDVFPSWVSNKSILLEAAFVQVAEFNDSCLHDIALYSKESLGSYLETNWRKDNIEEQNKRSA